MSQDDVEKIPVVLVDAEAQQRALAEEKRQIQRGVRFAQQQAALHRGSVGAAKPPPPPRPEGRSTTGPSVGIDGDREDEDSQTGPMPVTGPYPESALRAKRGEALRDHIETFITGLRRSRP